MSIERLIQLIKPLDPVAAGVPNRALRDADQRIRYIWDVLQAAALGSTVYLRRKQIEPEAQKGMAVYYNASTGRFERGLGVVEVNEETGAIRADPRAQVWGIVAEKLQSTIADILLYGVDDVDLTNAVDGTVTAGVYYLSPTTPGKLTRTIPAVPVPVLRAVGDGTVFVSPKFVDKADAHEHHKFELVCRPAGRTSPPDNDDARHTITDPDHDAEGWLPASEFGDNAPAHAVFGYNIAANTALAAAWPPNPISSATLKFDRGLDLSMGASDVPLGTDKLCVIDTNGIWWMSDCYGDVPWATTLNTDTGNSASDSESSNPECPRTAKMSMAIYFTRTEFVTDSTAVLSLQSRDSRLRVYCRNTDRAASTGHLDLSLNLNLTVSDNEDGYYAIKEFDPDTNKFRRGPICEGIYALSDNVTLTGDQSVQLIPSDPTSPTLYRGRVGVAVSLADTLELPIQLTRLDGAEQDRYQDTPYISLKAGELRKFRSMLYVPSDLSIANPKLAIRLLILGRAAGTLPALTVTYRRLRRPASGLASPRALPTSSDETSATINTVAVLSSGNYYVEATSTPFTILPGDTVYFTVTRAASDGYSGEIGILRQAAVVTSGG